MEKSIWLTTMQNLNFDNNFQEFERIVQAYNQKYRQYHNLRHVIDCLNKTNLLEETRTDSTLKLAIWYHDIVYKIFKKDNELKSAEQATTFLMSQDADESLKTKVFDLIMATIHKDKPQNRSEAYIMDIDISILGSNSKRYNEYCNQIRKEYKLIPTIIYRKKRAEIMKMFLKRETIYYSEYYKTKFEVKARENIENEIISLES